MGGRKVGGIAVHAAARVMGVAAADEILVTSIVEDLAAGADINFEDRGVRELRGVPGEWRGLFHTEWTDPRESSGVESNEPSRAGRVGLRRKSPASASPQFWRRWSRRWCCPA